MSLQTHHFQMLFGLVASVCASAGCAVLAGNNQPPPSRAETMWVLSLDANDTGYKQQPVHTSLSTEESGTPIMNLKPRIELAEDKFITGFNLSSDSKRVVLSVLDVSALLKGKGLVANIWTKDLTNTAVDAVSPVTEGSYLDFTPAFAMNDSYIYFATNRAIGKPAIWSKSLTEVGGLNVVTSGDAFDQSPVPNPKRGLLLYMSNDHIWTSDLKGNDRTQLCKGESPHWSNDGSMIVLCRRTSSGNRNIFKMNANGSGLESVASGFADDCDPSWSPDGQFIVFSSNRSSGGEGAQQNYDIYMIPTAGGLPQQLTSNLAHDDNPRWLDSKTILFRSNRGNTWKVWSCEVQPSAPVGGGQ